MAGLVWSLTNDSFLIVALMLHAFHDTHRSYTHVLEQVERIELFCAKRGRLAAHLALTCETVSVFPDCQNPYSLAEPCYSYAL